MFSVLDASEAYVVERVRSKIKEEVQRKLIEEIAELIQETTNKIVSEMIITLHSERDVMRRAEQVHVLLEWIKCREEKKRYVSETVVKEVGSREQP